MSKIIPRGIKMPNMIVRKCREILDDALHDGNIILKNVVIQKLGESGESTFAGPKIMNITNIAVQIDNNNWKNITPVDDLTFNSFNLNLHTSPAYYCKSENTISIWPIPKESYELRITGQSLPSWFIELKEELNKITNE